MLGIDLGSRNVKIVSVETEAVKKKVIYDTITFYRNFSRLNDGKMVVDWALLDLPEEPVVATGYGKMSVSLADARQIPEIQAHVTGAVHQSGYRDFTLVDIGGQDTKVVCVREGRAVDFLTNDRCASGSGRYLENMASVIGIDAAELGSYHEDPVLLNSTCAIFGETEIIARIIEGYPTERLAAGVNEALYRRLAPMIKQMKSELIILGGGGALNKALSCLISEDMRVKVEILSEPQFNGAIGCCVWGIDNFNKGGAA
ncbi:MAG: acyl-CoA dehydratase activase [Syntrophomonadaceae bacterium]|nr:acyl-CoA dehydratase activase [Syntrophomonadaceae bacterium]